MVGTVLERWRARREGHRQDGVTRTRFQFLVLALVALVVLLVPIAVLAPPLHRLVVVLPALVLGASLWFGHSRRRAPWFCDLADAACLTAFVVLSPIPTPILSITFALLWFRSMYGSTSRAFVRMALFQAAIMGGLQLWPLVQGGRPFDQAAAIYSSFTMMALNVGVIRGLAGGLRGRDEAARREAVVASLGAELLEAESAGRVRSLTSAALSQLCATTPGLSLVVAVADGHGFRVRRSWGPEVVPVGGVPGVGPIAGSGLGEQIELVSDGRRGWGYLRFPDTGEAWLLVAGPRRTVAEGMPAVRAVVHHVALALRNTESRDALQAQARTDALTGLPNRAAFHDAVGRAMSAGAEADCAMLFIDLDGFKAVNDGLGHAAGDTLLKTVAARLRQVVREDDLCARLGGDEFAVLLPGADEESAASTGRRIIAALSEPVLLTGATATIGASVGAAVAASAEDGEALVRNADMAMYSAKAAGKGCVHVGGGATGRVTPGIVSATRSTGSQPPRSLSHRT